MTPNSNMEFGDGGKSVKHRVITKEVNMLLLIAILLLVGFTAVIFLVIFSIMDACRDKD